MSNRSDTEQIIRDLFTAYRASPLDSSEIVEMAMTALDERNVFVKRDLTPVAASTTQPLVVNADHITSLINGLASVSVEIDTEDDPWIYLYCNDCQEVINDNDDMTGNSIKYLMDCSNNHWKDQHT